MVIFRADVSPRTGLRPLRRCAWLASLLKNCDPDLVCCRESKNAAKFLAERHLPSRFVKDPSSLDLAGALAVIFDLDPFSPADRVLLERAKDAGVKTLQVLGLGDARQAVDILVPVLPGMELPALPGQIVISGPEYALLHHKFRHFNRARRKYRRNSKNVFINLGDLLAYRDLRALVDTLHRLRFKMKIAPGLDLKKADKRNLMKIYPGIHFCGKSESLARAYFEADLALIPPGEETWEAAAVGTPALYLPRNEGRDTLADTSSDLGLGVKVPALAGWSVQAIRGAIEPLTPVLREKMGATGKALVDGLGVQRFFKVLKENGIIE